MRVIWLLLMYLSTCLAVKRLPTDKSDETMKYLRQERAQRQAALDREEMDLNMRKLQVAIEDGLDRITELDADIESQYGDEAGHKDLLGLHNLLSRSLERNYNTLVELKKAKAVLEDPTDDQPILPKMPKRQEYGMQTVFMSRKAIGNEKAGAVFSALYVTYNGKQGVLTNHHCIPSRQHAETAEVYFNFNIYFDGLAPLVTAVPQGRGDYKRCARLKLDPNHYYTGGAANRKETLGKKCVEKPMIEQDKLLMFYENSLDWAFVALANDVSVICPETKKVIRPYDLEEAIKVLNQLPNGHRAKANQELMARHHATGRARAMSFLRVVDQRFHCVLHHCQDTRNALIMLANNGKEFTTREDSEEHPASSLTSGASGCPIFDVEGALVGLHSHSLINAGEKVASLAIQIDHVLKSLQFAASSSSEDRLCVDTKVSIQDVKEEDIAPNFNAEERQARTQALEDDVKSTKDMLANLEAEIDQIETRLQTPEEAEKPPEETNRQTKDDSSATQSKDQIEKITEQLQRLREDQRKKKARLEKLEGDLRISSWERKEEKPKISNELLARINNSKAIVHSQC